MDELAKCNATTQMELNKAYENGDNENCIKKIQEMCIIMSTDSDICSDIWNDMKNINLLVTYNFPQTTTSTYDVLCCYKKPASPC